MNGPRRLCSLGCLGSDSGKQATESVCSNECSAHRNHCLCKRRSNNHTRLLTDPRYLASVVCLQERLSAYPMSQPRLDHSADRFEQLHELHYGGHRCLALQALRSSWLLQRHDRDCHCGSQALAEERRLDPTKRPFLPLVYARGWKLEVGNWLVIWAAKDIFR